MTLGGVPGVGLGPLCVVMVRRNPGSAWLVHFIRLKTRLYLCCYGVQFAVYAMALVVGVGP